MYAQFYRYSLVVCLLFIVNFQLSAQLEVKLALIQNNKWGVFVKPDGVSPSASTVTGSGLLTVVMPLAYEWTNFQTVNGLWTPDVTVDGIADSPEYQFIHFGLADAEPDYPIPYQEEQETLLFTFDGDGTCPDTMFILDCFTYNTTACGTSSSDPVPFDLSVLDFGGAGIYLYKVVNTYSPKAWDCNDNDMDGFANGLEDQNGNGIFDSDDVSDLNNGNDFPEPSGLRLKLQLLEENQWGVFVKTDEAIDETTTAISGQITLVMPKNYDLNGFTSVNGIWEETTFVSGPSENPSTKYTTYSLVEAEPNHPIEFNGEEEMLLFTFHGEGTCPNHLRIMNCGFDPFCPPNSLNTNPLNDLLMLSAGSNIGDYHTYVGNYAIHAWDCDDNDGDGILNALEDTNGNGIFDEGDESDLNMPVDVPLEDGLKMKLQLIGNNTWGVYATPHNVSPDSTTITGSGQVTVVMPNGYPWSNLQSFGGLWQANNTVVGPVENPDAQYISFGLLQAEPSYPIRYTAGVETLLFTFVGSDCPDFLHLIDCGMPNQSDPFCAPNTYNSNPGNDLSVIQFGGGIQYYNYIGNYAHNAWDCFDNDGDGYANALEDTNNSSVFDSGDASDLNDAASIPLEDGLKLKLQLIEENTWGVYAKMHGQQINHNTITGSGQVTVVMPAGIEYTYTSVNGLWSDNAHVEALPENPNRKYVSFGLLFDDPDNPIDYNLEEETLLLNFTIDSPCPDSLYLIDCGSPISNDPFCSPNSYNSNPGNDLSVLEYEGDIDDPNTFNAIATYGYVGNYAPSAWSCNDADNDGIPNALEDTNGNGQFNAGVDASDMYDACDPNGIIAINITEQPQNQSVCINDQVTISVDAENVLGIVMEYQWQYSVDGVNFFDASTPAFSDINTSTLVIVDPAGLHGIYFRCLISAGDCTTIESESAQLFVDGPITITDHPDNVEICYGEPFEMTADATILNGGTINYQWYLSPDEGLTWVSIDNTTNGGVYDGWNTKTLTCNDSDGLYSLCYQLRFSTDICGNGFSTSTPSNLACLTLQGPLEIINQPDDMTTCGEEPFWLAIDIDNQSLDLTNEDYVSYQWEESADGGITWNNLSNGLTPSGGDGVNGATSDTLSVMETNGRDGHLFRCLVYSEFCDTLISEPAIYNSTLLAFTNHPSDVSTCNENEAFFTFQYENPLMEIVLYQWQENDGTDWTDLEDGLPYNNTNGIISGMTGGDTLAITNSLGLDNHQYRVCISSSLCGEFCSETATLNVHGEIEITQHPEDVTACSGDPVCFEVEAMDSGGGEIDYNWQYSVDDVNWYNSVNSSLNSGVNTEFFCISDITGNDSLQYRCQISTSCETVFSDPALIIEEGPITFTQHPQNISACSGEGAIFFANAEIQPGNSGIISYQWQASSDGVNFNNILNGGGPGFASVNSNQLTINNVVGLQGWHFRLRANTNECGDKYSLAAIINVEGPLSVAEPPQDYTNCPNGEALFVANIFNPSDPAALQTLYQWQILIPGANEWQNLTNGDSFNGTNIVAGTNSDTLLITPLFDLDGALVRMQAWTNQCDTILTETAEIILLNGSITEFTDMPDDVTTCSGEAVEFMTGLNIMSGDPSEITYQWEYNFGSGWYNLPENQTYIGTETDQLTIAEANPNMHGWKFRVTVGNEECPYDNYSDYAELNIEGPIYFAEPLDIEVDCVNEVVFIYSNVINEADTNSNAVHYQWQMLPPGQNNWADLHDGDFYQTIQFFGTTGDYLIIAGFDEIEELKFRLEVKAWPCETVFSEEVNIVVSTNQDLTISSQPQDVTTCDDSEALFTVDVDAPNDPTGENTYYQWQIKYPFANDWEDIYNGITGPNNVNIFGGFESDTLLITPLSGLNGAQVRVKAWADLCNVFYSEPANIAVEGPIIFTQQPLDIAVCENEQVCFNAEVNNQTGLGDLEYRWQVSGNNITWSDILTPNQLPFTIYGLGSNQICITEPLLGTGLYFRLAAKTGECEWEYATAAQILNSQLEFTEHPADALVCEGNPHTFIASINLPAVNTTYQWQASNDLGISWADLSENQITALGGIYQNVNSPALHISLVDGLGGYQYRLKTWTGQCEAFSEPASLSVDYDHVCDPQVPYVSLGVKLMPSKLNWGVYLKPIDGFEPSGDNKLTGAEVTIAATQGFVPKNLQSQAGGNWAPTAVLFDTPEQPGLSFFTFEVTPNNNSLNLTEDGVLLFTFFRQDDCPDTLFIMNEEIPNGLHPNFITGIDLGSSPNDTFYLGGYHQIGTKGCKNPIVVEDTPGEDVDTGMGLMANDQRHQTEGLRFELKKSTSSFHYFPNPANEEVNVQLQLEPFEQANLKVISLQGQTLQIHPLKNNTNHLLLDLSQTTPGMYFIILEKDGEVVQQEKLIVK